MKMKKYIAIFLSLAISAMCFVSCSDKKETTNNVPNQHSSENADGKTEESNGLKVGDYIKFGKYEQDNDTSNGSEEIEWLVLKVEDDKALVISKFALDCKHYNKDSADVTWEDSSIRTWLNIDFANVAFSNEEKANIISVDVTADKNPTYDTNVGNATKDSVFLLSIEEAATLFKNNEERICEPTAYTLGKNVYKNDKGNCFWWLRTPGEVQSKASAVYVDGIINNKGYMVEHGNSAVRPAMWINIEE